MQTVVCVGIATLDLVLSVATLPSVPGKYRAGERVEVGGGVAANAAVAVARLGGRAEFFGRVGDDPVGDRIVAGLEHEGVGVSGVQRVAGSASPVSIALIDGKGERLIVNHAGPELFASGDAAIGAADAVLADMRWPSGGAGALRAARAAGIPAILDCDHDPAGREETLAAATHIVFAQSTLAAYAGSAAPADSLPRAAARTGAWVAVTAGAGGVYWLDGDQLNHVPAFAVEAVDTLGAGDVFHGAFALGLADGMAPEPALRRASAAAAIKCTRFGGREGIPTRSEVDAFMGDPAVRRGPGRPGMGPGWHSDQPSGEEPEKEDPA